MKIFIASSNDNKIKEIRNIIDYSFADLNLELHSIKNMNIAEPDEPYQTFMENAIHKAEYYAKFTQAPTFSEDSGLCITALNNFPGVRTKDFLLECGSLDKAFDTLENMMKEHDDYTAHFICAAALYIPAEKRLITFEGKDNGKISFPARGEKCFGFDPIFMPNGYNNTMAELGDLIKNTIGHRASAVRGIAEQLSYTKI